MGIKNKHTEQEALTQKNTLLYIIQHIPNIYYIDGKKKDKFPSTPTKCQIIN